MLRTYFTKKNESVQVQEWVTTDHSRGCRASVKFTPDKNGVYLLDYANTNINRGCTVQAYRQVPIEGGRFKLSAVGKTPAKE